VRALFYNKEANAAGCYLIKFYVNGVPTGVMIDDLFLTDGKTVWFSRSKGGKFWVSLIEKAWAKLLGSYTRIVGAFSEFNVLHVLSGTPSDWIDLKKLRNDKKL